MIASAMTESEDFARAVELLRRAGESFEADEFERTTAAADLVTALLAACEAATARGTRGLAAGRRGGGRLRIENLLQVEPTKDGVRLTGVYSRRVRLAQPVLRYERASGEWASAGAAQSALLELANAVALALAVLREAAPDARLSPRIPRR